MKKCEVKKLWVHLPKVLFGLAGLLIVYLFYYGIQIKSINYQFNDVKDHYYNFMNVNNQHSQSDDVASSKKENHEESLFATLAVDWVSVYRDTPYQGPKTYTDYTIRQRKLRALDHVKPLKPEFGVAINDVTDFTYIYETKCSQDSGKQKLFVAIVSAPVNIQKRNAVRETWLQKLLETEWTHFKVTGAAFIIGEPEQHYEQTVISTEVQEHNDVIQIKIPDRFSDLSKKVVGLFNWMHNNCNDIDYFLKVDDDVFVNPYNIDKLLGIVKPLEPTMIGTSIGNPPSREGKWAISYEEWPWNKYPRYITTAAVLITGNTISPLLAAFQTTPFMRFDDIYLAGICKEKADIHVITTTSMNARGAPDETDPCMIHNTVTWVTGSVERMRKWYSYTKEFYDKVTKCFTDKSNSAIDPSAAVDFLLVY